MAPERIQRKLSTILAADVAGYSRLMRADEEATLTTLDAYREIIDGLIGRHDGRVFSTGGDSVLADFGSAVEAVRCAITIQEEIAGRNSELADDRKPRFRIGINVGDVMVRGDDLFGDGVNVAARLEGLAEAGGVGVSGAVFEQIRHKLSLGFEDMGPQEVKNIAEPVSAFRLLPGPVSPPAAAAAARTPSAWRRRRMAAIGTALVVIAAGGLAWWQPWAPRIVPPPVENVAVSLPEKPAIAVLPFANMSGEKAQEYFSDDMTEDLITDLSRISALTVISRSSTFAYKGKSPDVRAVAKELNVGYVVEGSVRKVGNRIRITAQLIDAGTGAHLWVERYDRDFTDIFALQDEVRGKIVSALEIKLTEPEKRRVSQKETEDVAAYELYMKGLYQEGIFTRSGNDEALRNYRQAVAIDPGYAVAYARMANIYEQNTRNGWTDDVQRDLAKAVALAEKAIALDDENPFVHWTLGRIIPRLKSAGSKGAERGIRAFERAIELDPNYADAYAFLAILYIASGRAEDAPVAIETAMRLNPRYPFWYLHARGVVRYMFTDYKAAIVDFERAAERNPTVSFVQWWLAAAYAQDGRVDDAEWQVEEMLGMGSQSTVAIILETTIMRHPPYLKLHAEGLRKAGVPEK